MDVLEPICVILATVAKAIQVCQKRENVNIEWKSEKAFCSRLQLTLESIIECSPIDESFKHSQELGLLVQAVLQHLPHFYDVIAPCIHNLQSACEPYPSQEAIAQLASQLRKLVVQAVQTLRDQVDRYLKGINTLLLLYIIDILSSEPLEVVSEEQLVELHNLKRRAKVASLQDLEQLSRLFSAQTLNLEEQQRCLVLMRSDIEHYWEAVQMTLHGVWSEATNDTDDEMYASESSLDIDDGSCNRQFPSSQGQRPGPSNIIPSTSGTNNGNNGTNIRPRAPPPGRMSPGVMAKQVGSTNRSTPPRTTKTYDSQTKVTPNSPQQTVVREKPQPGRGQFQQAARYPGREQSHGASTIPGGRTISRDVDYNDELTSVELQQVNMASNTHGDFRGDQTQAQQVRTEDDEHYQNYQQSQRQPQQPNTNAQGQKHHKYVSTPQPIYHHESGNSAYGSQALMRPTNEIRNRPQPTAGYVTAGVAGGTRILMAVVKADAVTFVEVVKMDACLTVAAVLTTRTQRIATRAILAVF
ncbi:hypothetical protein PG993_011876 [Apiospora rasikravindrae]|uniref:Uncharacterized protein n=1 Tax=Apiospora rasikravindrae TaxID=990691 RepID=A0ABR1S2C0_9PEZI